MTRSYRGTWRYFFWRQPTFAGQTGLLAHHARAYAIELRAAQLFCRNCNEKWKVGCD